MASRIQGAGHWRMKFSGVEHRVIESETLDYDDLEALTRLERIIDRDGRIEVLGSRAVHIWRLSEES